MSSRSTPAWRRVVDRIDRLVTPPANAVVRTNAFADTIATALRLEARLRRRFEDQTAWVWHAWNLPTAVDIRRVQSQLAALEGRVRDMSEQLEQLRSEED
jgi:hypothetical protein